VSELAKILSTQGPLGLALVVQTAILLALANQLINKTVSRDLFEAQGAASDRLCHAEHCDVMEKLDTVIGNQREYMARGSK